MMKVMDTAAVAPAERLAYKRRLVAQLCRMLDPQPPDEGAAFNGAGAPADRGRAGNGANGHAVGRRGEDPCLSPRMRQTLDRLLAGDSEKEIAARFGRSRNTVHVYVKQSRAASASAATPSTTTSRPSTATSASPAAANCWPGG